MPLTDDEVLARFREIKTWKRGGERAPHKPLLLLLALSRLQRGDRSALEFDLIERPLAKLLRDFGPPRKSDHPEFPFWFLKHDRVWTLEREDELAKLARTGNTNPTARTLREQHARGALAADVVAAFAARPSLVNRAAAELLDANFPHSLHDDILSAVGFPWVVETDRRRSAEFRGDILRAYEYRCAVCAYDVRLGDETLGLEAAHVQWHAAQGPDSIDNGLALCVLHHKALDRGAIGIDDRHRILVSQDVNGSSGLSEWLVRFAGQPLRPPQKGERAPASVYIAWHSREVFRGKSRAA